MTLRRRFFSRSRNDKQQSARPTGWEIVAMGKRNKAMTKGLGVSERSKKTMSNSGLLKTWNGPKPRQRLNSELC
jgi:hypothetical protein